MNGSKIIAGLVMMFLLFALVDACLGLDKAEAEGALVSAEDDLSSAYVGVVKAEASGAEVSGLLERLRIAGDFLADAYNARRTGDFEAAYWYAMNCSSKVDGIVSEASRLALIARESHVERLLVTGGMSCVVLCGLFFLSLWGWIVLKRRYMAKVLGMKPEVEED